MLGKTAGGLYWMFRYLERSENITRMIDAGLRMSLTRPDSAVDEWTSVIDTAGVREKYDKLHETVSAAWVVDFLLRDRDNPSSVMSTIDAARTNARLVRTGLTREVWEATNDCWIQLTDLLEEPVEARELPGVLSMIRQQGALVRGALHGTMLRNDIYNFARIGTFLERADNTARILDVKYYVLLPTVSQVGSSLDNVQWETLLRSVSGHRAFRMKHGTEITPRRIADFLIFDRQMPRSLAFCLNKIATNLDYLEREYDTHHPCHDQIGHLQDSLASGTVEAVFDSGLHEFLMDFKVRNAAIGSQIEQDYRFHK